MGEKVLIEPSPFHLVGGTVIFPKLISREQQKNNRNMAESLGNTSFLLEEQRGRAGLVTRRQSLAADEEMPLSASSNFVGRSTPSEAAETGSACRSTAALILGDHTAL